MSTVWAVTRREIQAYFVSPIAYAFATVFLVLSAMAFLRGIETYVRIPEVMLEQTGGTIRTLLVAGVPMDRALEMMADLFRRGPMGPVAVSLLRDVRAGCSLSDAMRKARLRALERWLARADVEDSPAIGAAAWLESTGSAPSWSRLAIAASSSTRSRIMAACPAGSS